MCKLGLLLAILCLAATPSFALSEKPYITAADLDFPALLPPPPAETSAAGKLDLETSIDLQKGMTGGGHMTATLAVNQMMKNPEFRADFETVKAELCKGLGSTRVHSDFGRR